VGSVLVRGSACLRVRSCNGGIADGFVLVLEVEARFGSCGSYVDNLGILL